VKLLAKYSKKEDKEINKKLKCDYRLQEAISDVLSDEGDAIKKWLELKSAAQCFDYDEDKDKVEVKSLLTEEQLALIDSAIAEELRHVGITQRLYREVMAIKPEKIKE
jgi:hypothetical protein